MVKPTGISRRLMQCVTHLQSNDCEGALVNLFPAMDKTAKKRRPKDGVGKRIKAFLTDEEALISVIGTGNVLTNISINRVKIPDALYKFGRTPIAHEGELDPRLEFNVSGAIQIGAKKWNLPIGYITGMCVSVIVAPENKNEYIEQPLSINIFGKTFVINEIWGDRSEIENHICFVFKDPNLFARHRV
jgi:hypothetical protein